MYSSSTFVRAQGVLRRKVKEDLILGLPHFLNRNRLVEMGSALASFVKQYMLFINLLVYELFPTSLDCDFNKSSTT